MKEPERVLLRTMRGHLEFLTRLLLATLEGHNWRMWDGHCIAGMCAEKNELLEKAYNRVFPLRKSTGKKT